jgi:hypothetical protein
MSRRCALGEAELSTRNTVNWECQAPLHRALPSRHGNGGLTINDGGWAYCDGAGADDAHRWSATGGVPLESLVRWTAPNGTLVEGQRALAAASATNGGPKVSPKARGVRRG